VVKGYVGVYVSREYATSAKHGKSFLDWSDGNPDYGIQVATSSVFSVIGEKIMMGAKQRGGTVVSTGGTYLAAIEKGALSRILRDSVSTSAIFTPLQCVKILRTSPQGRSAEQLNYVVDFLKVTMM
jgi:hypothetical protein